MQCGHLKVKCIYRFTSKSFAFECDCEMCASHDMYLLSSLFVTTVCGGATQEAVGSEEERAPLPALRRQSAALTRVPTQSEGKSNHVTMY